MGKKGTRKKKGGSFFDGITFESITGVAKNFANDVMSGANELTKKGKEITNNSSDASQPAQQVSAAQQAPAASAAQQAPAAAKPITDPRTLTNEIILVGGKRKHRRSRNKRKSRKSRKSKSKKHRRRKTKKRRCNCPCKKC
jgi:hypothetical protein